MPDEFELPESLTKTVFNDAVHESTDAGDPKRNEDGTISLKKQWKKTATDRQGRVYNKAIHGKEIKLDDAGYLTVKRREAKLPSGSQGRTGAFVDKYREEGYAYYLFNDEAGELRDAVSRDWEPVTDKSGTATMNVGQARQPNTTANLMRKPLEWYEADQQLKVDQNELRYKQNASPSKEDGQYEAAANSPLR